MDAVKIFNAELAGLYECKPPISKAKMTAITKAAIRAIKFYKHVVQSVEKFIQKCKTEYKIPGLYVIDSIVRQSRHQFSIEKDVFVPRFAKNILLTFYYLFKCPQEDKSKVIRVLNLWQKNHIFGEEIIQPLFDLADPNHPIQKEIFNQISQKANKSKAASFGQLSNQHITAQPQQQQQPQHQRTPQQSSAHQPSALPPGIPDSLPTVTTSAVAVSLANQVTNSGVSTLDPNLIHQIQQILMKSEEGPVAVAALALQGTAPPGIPTMAPSHSVPTMNMTAAPVKPQSVLPLQTVGELKHAMVPGLNQTGDYDGRSLPFLPPVDTSQPPPGYHHQGFPVGTGEPPPPLPHVLGMPPGHLPGLGPTADFLGQPLCLDMKTKHSPREEGERTDDSEDNKENEHDRGSDRHRSRSRSYSRSRKNKRRSRSGSRSHYKRSRSRSRGKRSRSRDRRERDRARNREREKYDAEREREREKDRERKKRGLPLIKENHMSVCSTTLWVGHLSKLVDQEELSDTFGEYGDIVSIDLIPPRGCAFICMNRRQDASRALIKLKNHKMQNKAITLAWAPGKGVKGKDFKDYWEVDAGCSYVPFSKLSTMSNFDLDSLEEGGMIDEETVPSWMKGRYHGSHPHVIPNVNQPPPSHLPPNLMSLGVPPPSNGPDGRPSMPPPVDKDIRQEPQHMIPPMMPPFGIPNIPPPVGPGIPLGASLLPPNLPPLGVPPPIGIPPLNVPQVSSLMGPALIGVPPHGPMAPPPVSGSNLHENDSMDIEMEDMEKPMDAHLKPSLPREKLGVQIVKDGRFEPPREEWMEGEERELLLEEHLPHDVKDPFGGGPILGFRGDRFNAFGPLQRHPGFQPAHMGVVHRARPNFGPRGLPNMSGYGAPRGLMGPPLIGDPHHPNILPEFGGPRAIGIHGLPGPGAINIRPIGGLMPRPLHPRGLPIMNTYRRFGVIGEPHGLPLHDDRAGELLDTWTKSDKPNDLQEMSHAKEKPAKPTAASENTLEKPLPKPDAEKGKEDKVKKTESNSDLVDKVPTDEAKELPHKTEPQNVVNNRDVKDRPELKRPPDNEEPMRRGSGGRFREENFDKGHRSYDRDGNRARPWERNRIPDYDRDWNRNSNRDWDRDRGRERDFGGGGGRYREIDRYREDYRGRERPWDRPRWDDRRPPPPREDGFQREEFDWTSWNSMTDEAIPPPPSKKEKVKTAKVPPSKPVDTRNSLVAIISSLSNGKKSQSEALDNPPPKADLTQPSQESNNDKIKDDLRGSSVASEKPAVGTGLITQEHKTVTEPSTLDNVQNLDFTEPIHNKAVKENCDKDSIMRCPDDFNNSDVVQMSPLNINNDSNLRPRDANFSSKISLVQVHNTFSPQEDFSSDNIPMTSEVSHYPELEKRQIAGEESSGFWPKRVSESLYFEDKPTVILEDKQTGDSVSHLETSMGEGKSFDSKDSKIEVCGSIGHQTEDRLRLDNVQTIEPPCTQPTLKRLDNICEYKEITPHSKEGDASFVPPDAEVRDLSGISSNVEMCNSTGNVIEQRDLVSIERGTNDILPDSGETC